MTTQRRLCIYQKASLVFRLQTIWQQPASKSGVQIGCVHTRTVLTEWGVRKKRASQSVHDLWDNPKMVTYISSCRFFRYL